MAIGGVGGNQPIENKPQVQNNNTIEKSQVSPEQISIFNKADVDGNNKLEGNEVKSFKQMVADFLKNVTGGNKTEQPQQTGTAADVNAATNTPSTDKSEAQFNEDGSLKSDVKMNEDGSKTIKAGNETIEVTKDGSSFSVKNEDGKQVSVSKTPDGGFEFKDEDGKVHKFDKDMNPKT